MAEFGEGLTFPLLTQRCPQVGVQPVVASAIRATLAHRATVGDMVPHFGVVGPRKEMVNGYGPAPSLVLDSAQSAPIPGSSLALLPPHPASVTVRPCQLQRGYSTPPLPASWTPLDPEHPANLRAVGSAVVALVLPHLPRGEPQLFAANRTLRSCAFSLAPAFLE